MSTAITLLYMTQYAGQYVGKPLFCSTPDNPLYYDPDSDLKWIALDVDSVNCGDLVYLRWANGNTLMVRVLDAGPLSRYCVKQADGSCAQIGGDVPSHLWQGDESSGWVEFVNLSEMARGWEEWGRGTD